MKAASPALKTFLVNTPAAVWADLYTFTLNGGAVLRYTSADIPVFSTYYFAPAAGISDDGVKSKTGVAVDNLTIEIKADARYTVNGVPLVQFIRDKGFDGALIKVERAYAADWSSAFVGSYVRFSGRFSECQDASDYEVTVIAASGMELLNVDMPADVYQSSCLNTLFDPLCGLNRDDYDAAGTVGAGSATQLSFPSNIIASENVYALGSVVFNSGPNAGLRRTVRAQAPDGTFVLVLPLPAPPAPGDTFTAYPGCDLSKGRCDSYNNRIHFRGFETIPLPEVAI